MSANVEVKPNGASNTMPTGTEWIDRYVNEVGRRLPPNQRVDVQQEIRSLIEDEVAGRLQAAADEGSAQLSAETTVLAVLEQFGPPEEMAARYQAPRYLIGPAMFPVYQIVLGIVLTVTFFANLLALAVAAGAGSVQPLLDTFADLFAGVLQAFGTVTLIFMALERLGVSASQKKVAIWDPRSLPPVKDEQRISVFEKAVEIGFTAAVLGLAANYLNGRSAIFYSGEWQPMSLFSPEVLQYIPWLMVIWGADILVNIVLLARGRWEPATRIAAMVVDGANALVFYQLLVGSPIAAWPPLDPAFRITAAIIFAVSVWEVARNAWRLLRSSTWGEATLHSQHLA